MKQYAVGSKWIYKDRRNETPTFSCEIVAPDDPRMNKMVLPGDICVYYTDLGWGTTYDKDVLDSILEPACGGVG